MPGDVFFLTLQPFGQRQEPSARHKRRIHPLVWSLRTTFPFVKGLSEGERRRKETRLSQRQLHQEKVMWICGRRGPEARNISSPFYHSFSLKRLWQLKGNDIDIILAFGCYENMSMASNFQDLKKPKENRKWKKCSPAKETFAGSTIGYYISSPFLSNDVRETTAN